jgi:hypothetical protein
MANKIATILGVGFLLVGIAGFVAPSLLGMHLSMTHNVIHLASGAVSLWFGLKGTPSAARSFCIAFGAFYGLLGVAGFLFGTSATPTVPGPADARLLRVIPGAFEPGTSDHIVHILLGAIYLFGGLASRRTATPVTATRP